MIKEKIDQQAFLLAGSPTPPLTERYSFALGMVYLLSLPFQTRGEPLFFLSNALREYSGLTIWPHDLALRQYALRARKSFIQVCPIEIRNFFTSDAAEIAYFSSANRELSNATGDVQLRRRKIVVPTIRDCFTLVKLRRYRAAAEVL